MNSPINVGDVLLWPSGALRVVRYVHDYRSKSYSSLNRIALGFAIRHCSWTKAGYTLYFWGELLHKGVRKVARVNLDSPLDKKLERDIIDSRRPCRVSCCQAVGLP